MTTYSEMSKNKRSRRYILILLLLLISLFIYNRFFDRDTDKNFDLGSSLKQLSQDPEYAKYFGGDLDKLATLDTDKDGTPDMSDTDIDNDGIPNSEDTDLDGDGTPNASDPSSALITLVGQAGSNGQNGATGDNVVGRDGQNGISGAIGSDGADGEISPAGVNGINGATGATGPQGPAGATGVTGATGATGSTGPQGPTGTVGVVTDDGVIDTTLTGSDLDIQLLLASGSGLEKLGSGLSLTTTCASNEVLKWDGSVWNCSTDQTGISYTAGTGIDITGSVVSSILGDIIDSSEIEDGTIVTDDLAADSVGSTNIINDAVTSGKILDGTVAFNDMNDNGCAAGQIVKFNGTNWSCAADVDTDTDTTYTAGDGLSLVGTEFNIDPSNLGAISSVVNSDVIIVGTASGPQKITYNDLFGNILGALNYRGTWNASTNSPDLTAYCDSSTKGHYYVVAGPGATNLGGFTPWANNDWVICDGTSWQQIESTNDVNSVFGRVGPVTAQNGDYTASQITNVPAGTISSTNVQAAINELATETLSNNLNSGFIYVGNGSNVATAVPVSGDIILLNTGAASVNPDAITSGKILNGTIVTADIANNAITGGAGGVILDNSITASDLAPNSVAASEIAANAVGQSEIATSGVATAEILDGTILFADMSANGCTTNQIIKRTASAWVCTADTDTTYTAGTGISINGANAISSTLGTDIVSSEIVDGTIATADIANDAITNAKLANDSVTTTEILDGTITTADLANLSVTTAILADGSVTNIKLATDSVTTVKVQDGAIITSKLADGSVTNIKIAADAVTSAKILDGTIATADLANASVTVAKIQPGSNNQVLVTDGSGNVAWVNKDAFGAIADNVTIQGTGTTADPFLVKDLGITTAKLADSAVTTTKLADGAVTTIKLADASVSTAKVIDAAITTAKLADGSVTNTKLATDSVTTVKIADSAVTTAKLADGSVTSVKIAADAVTSAKILDGTIATADLADSSITTIKLGNDSVTSAKIVDGTITAADIADASITFAKLANCANNEILKHNGTTWICAADTDTTYTAGTGVTISGLNVISATLGTDIVSSEIVDGTIVTADIATGGVTTGNILDATITSTDISTGGVTTTNILDSTVSTADIANDAITTGKILDGTILFGDLASNGCTSGQIAKYSGTAWACAADDNNGGVTTIATIDAQTKSANGAVIVGSNLYMQTADTSFPGLVSTSVQSFAGNKTFTGNASVNGDTTLGDASSDTVTINGTAVSIPNNLNFDTNTLYLDATNNRVGIGNAAPNNKLEVTTGTSGTSGLRFTNLTSANTGAVNNGKVLTVDGSGDVILQDVAYTTDYLNVRRATTNQNFTGNVGITNQDIILNNVVAGNMTFNTSTGVASLIANRTYRIQASMHMSGGSARHFQYALVNATTNVALSPRAEVIAVTSGNYASPGYLDYVFTPSSNVNVKLRVLGGDADTGEAIRSDLYSGMTIQQIGASPATMVVAPDSLNYTEFSDTMALDATTTTSLGANNMVTNLDSTGDFLIQDNGATVLSLLDDGSFLHQNAVNSTSAFKIANAAGTGLLKIDTTGNSVQIGDIVADATGALLVLDTKNTAGDPTGTNGAMYYNSNMGKFRCYENSIWVDCIGSPPRIASQVANSTPVTLDTIKVQVVAGGNGFQIGTVSGTISYNLACTSAYGTGNNTFSSNNAQATLTTTMTNPFAWAGQNDGDGVWCTLQDRTNNKVYEIRTITNFNGAGPATNFIQIEKVFG